MHLIMSKLQRVILVATLLIVTLGIISKLIHTVQEQRDEIGRLDRNVASLASNEVSYVTKLGDAAQQRKALELSQKELKTVNADLYKEISALRVRLKDARSATRVITKTLIEEKVRVDTINNVIVAEYRDDWNTIRSEQQGDSARLSYVGKDTIVGVVSVKRKRFLFFRYGIKSVNYDISNKNPNTKISIDIAVQLK
nr:MAG TPA: hypothetical protein [Caudoviricetes sp.]